MTNSYFDTAVTNQPIQYDDAWMSDEDYTAMVAKTVIACVDVAFYSRKKKGMYLARRCTLPQKGLWVLGGRLIPKDRSTIDGVLRKLVEETGFHPDRSRLEYLTTNFYHWDRVAQGDMPGANLVVIFMCEITEQEALRIGDRLVQSEYEQGYGLQLFTRKRMTEELCHPALIDMYDLIFSR